MKTSWFFIGFLVLNFVLSTAGDTAAKLWAINPGQKWFWITVALSLVTSISFMLVVREGGLTVGSTIMLLLTMLSTALIGLLVFGERVDTSQWIGFVFGFIAVFFLLGIIRISI